MEIENNNRQPQPEERTMCGRFKACLRCLANYVTACLRCLADYVTGGREGAIILRADSKLDPRNVAKL